MILIHSCGEANWFGLFQLRFRQESCVENWWGTERFCTDKTYWEQLIFYYFSHTSYSSCISARPCFGLWCSEYSGCPLKRDHRDHFGKRRMWSQRKCLVPQMYGISVVGPMIRRRQKTLNLWMGVWKEGSAQFRGKRLCRGLSYHHI